MTAQNPLISDIGGYVDRVAKLFRLDATLLTIETKQNVQSIVVVLALFVGALATVFLGVVILLFAVVLLLVQLGLTPSLAAFLVAAVLLCISAALAFIGIERLKGWSLTPRRTIAQFTSNLEALRASMRNEANG